MAVSETLRYTAFLEAGDDGWLTVRCPALPGCVSQGRTRDDALKNIREAIELYVESVREDDEAVPREDIEVVEVRVPLALP